MTKKIYTPYTKQNYPPAASAEGDTTDITNAHTHKNAGVPTNTQSKKKICIMYPKISAQV